MRRTTCTNDGAGKVPMQDIHFAAMKRMGEAGPALASVQSSGNLVAGNHIGTNAAGTAALLNHGPGGAARTAAPR